MRLRLRRRLRIRCSRPRILSWCRCELMILFLVLLVCSTVSVFGQAKAPFTLDVQGKPATDVVAVFVYAGHDLIAHGFAEDGILTLDRSIRNDETRKLDLFILSRTIEARFQEVSGAELQG